ncbi:MAG: hypothetical protein SPG60_05360, partial [Eubacterium coprostanoligenes]|nr:hypothetical protein [Eubacterium coprostanoligenes]
MYLSVERVEKVFSARYRLLRKVLNFVFLRTLLYDGTACSQKTKNAKNAVGSIPTAFLKPLRQRFVFPPPLSSMGGIILLIIFGVFQELYRQSEPTDTSSTCRLFY